MRRSKDDKRVLRSGNGRQQNSRNFSRNGRKLLPRRQKRNNVPVNRRNSRNPKSPRRKTKASGKVIFIMIFALVAFVIGAGIGVSLIFEQEAAENAPHFENVTKEMTSNLNVTEDFSYDKDIDAVDYNENTTSQYEIQYQYGIN